MKRKLTAFFLLAALLLTLCTGAFAQDASSALQKTAAYVLKAVPAPQVGSVGGEWAVLGLARSGYPVPANYYEAYYKAVEKTVKDCGGVLHNRKYTEYSRVIVALSAIGKDARSVAGCDLTKPLGDFDKTVWQGLNGAIWALLALDCTDCPMPQNPEAKTQATRQMYIDHILSAQRTDGGWSLNASAESADVDVTAMALQALAKYQEQTQVKSAIDRALVFLSDAQDASGGFSSWNTANSESTAQVIVALCELGISTEDARFVKSGNTLLSNLLSYQNADGSFRHTQDGSTDQMATEQALYALAAMQRVQSGQTSLYRMTEKASAADSAAVQKTAVTNPGKTFSDVKNHKNQAAIEALAARGIINGKTETAFDPDATMTRAEFAAIVVRALGLTPKASSAFSDVKASAWYAPYIGTASACGIVSGVGGGKFNPSGTITKQEAAAMVARAAKLCGLDTARSAASVQKTLGSFTDGAKISDWARESLAFCYDSGILDGSAKTVTPTAAVRRCEIAQMLYNLLKTASLL